MNNKSEKSLNILDQSGFLYISLWIELLYGFQMFAIKFFFFFKKKIIGNSFYLSIDKAFQEKNFHV